MPIDLSILVPSKDEEFLVRTVEDILSNSEAETEIVVIEDGGVNYSHKLPKDPRVVLVRNKKSVGQRAATNQAARVAKGKYVMKIDAHCSFDQGFDRKMLEAFKEVGDDVTMVPNMKNLHVFNWKCDGCGEETYQGPLPEGCAKCDVNWFHKEMKWIAKKSPNSTSYRFNTALRFQYFGEYKKQQKGDLVESMSLQGSCFMLTKERYFKLNICDETWGSWGQFGTEVALKSWLSGGRVICNRATWYAHLFRTQPGFSHPWGNPGKCQEQARMKCQDMFYNNKWEHQVHPLVWLLEKFWPVPGWDEEDLQLLREGREPKLPTDGKEGYARAKKKHKPTKGALFYTNRPPAKTIYNAAKKQLKVCIKEKHIVSVTPEAEDFGKNIVMAPIVHVRWLDLFERILTGLEASDAEIIYLTEHDVLYHPSYFAFIPPKKDVFYYNTNVYKVRAEDGHCLYVDDCKQLSGLVAYRELLLEHYRERVRRIRLEGFKRGNGFEPGTRGIKRGGYDNHHAEGFKSEYPNLDIRHGTNATENRWSKDKFRNQKFTEGWTESDTVPGWDEVPQFSDI